MKRQILSAILLGIAVQAHGDAVTQSITAPSVDDWNSSAIWSNGQVPSASNTYSTATGLATSGGPDVSQTSPNLSSSAYTDTIRAIGTTFGGASLTIVGNTRLLIKGGGIGSSGNLILANNGNIVNGDGGFTDSLGGTLQVGSSAGDTGFLYSNNTGNGIFTVSSTLTGLGTLAIGAEFYSGFLSGVSLTGSDNSFGGTLEYFTTGTFSISSLSDSSAGLDFSSATLGSAVSSFSSSNSLTVGALQLGSTSLAAGTYTGAQLDAAGATTIFSTDTSLITVVPEPNVCVLLLGGFASLLGVKRIFRRHEFSS